MCIHLKFVVFYFLHFLHGYCSPGGPNHASCIHHVSRETLEIMCKTKAIAACPIAGCRGKWSKATAVLDEAFQRRVTRFLLSKEAQQGGNGSGSSSSSSAKQATAHDVDGDYTQL